MVLSLGWTLASSRIVPNIYYSKKGLNWGRLTLVVSIWVERRRVGFRSIQIRGLSNQGLVLIWVLSKSLVQTSEYKVPGLYTKHFDIYKVFSLIYAKHIVIHKVLRYIQSSLLYAMYIGIYKVPTLLYTKHFVYTNVPCLYQIVNFVYIKVLCKQPFHLCISPLDFVD